MAATDDLIETIVASQYPDPDPASDRSRHVMREALRSLVRMGQAEQMLALRQQVSNMIATPSTRH